MHPADDLSLELHTEVSEPLIRELLESEPMADAADTDLEDLRTHLTGDHIMGVLTARRSGRLVGWATLMDPGPEHGSLIVMLLIHNDRDDVYLGLLSAARDAARARERDAVQWIAQDPIGERLAIESKAEPHHDLGRLWRAERAEWRSKPTAEVEDLPNPPDPDTLERYAQLYTDARFERCDDSGCTTRWDASNIEDALADRDESMDTAFSVGYIEPDGRMCAECSTGVHDDVAHLFVVEADATEAQLVSVLIGTLDRLRESFVDVVAAEMTTSPEASELGEALRAAGFDVIGRATEYRLPV